MNQKIKKISQQSYILHLIKIYIVSFLVFLFGATAFGQAHLDCNCFVKGIIKDQHTGQGIPGATIYITKSNIGVTSDANGKYEIKNLCPGTYEIECRLVGYSPFKHLLDLTTGHEEDISLSEQEIHLNDVEITALRTDAPSSQPLNQITGKELFETRGQTLAESMKGLTGVAVLQTGTSIAKPVIHGLHSNRVLIMNNGVRQEGQQWGSEHAPEIDPFIATRLSVVKGAAGVRYGSDAIGGVILVDMDELPFDKPLSGEVNAVGMSNGRQGITSGTLQGGLPGLKGLGWRLQGTVKRAGNVRTPHYFLDNTGTSEKNFSISTGYRKKGFGIDLFYSFFDTKIGIFSGSHIGSVTDLLEVLQNGEPFVKSGFSYEIGRPYQKVTHQLAKAEAHYHFQDGNRIQWTIANQLNDRSEFDLHRPRNDSIANLNHPELNFRLNTLTNDIVWDHKPIAGKFSGQVGVSTLYQYNLMDGRPLIPNFNQFTTGLFLIERYVKNNWELEVGARFDYRHLITHQIINREKVSHNFDFSNFSGTAGGTYNFSPNLTASFNFGTAWRAPNVSELFSDGVHHGAAAYEQGNAALSPEIAYNSIGSIKYQVEKLNIEIGAYYNYIHNYIYLKPQPEPILTIRGAFPYFKYTQTNASFKGIDINYKWEFVKSVSVASKLTYLQVYDQSAKNYLVMIPANRLDNGIHYELEQWAGFKNFHLGLNNLWVAQQKRVPENSDFTPPPAAYSLWNFQAGGTLPITDKNQLELSVSIQNIFNTTYRDYLNRFRYYADDIGRQVSLRLRWQFGTIH